MEAPDTSVLSRALTAYLEAPEYDSDRHLRPLLEALAASTLIVARQDGEVLTVEGEESEDYIALFTDLVELHFFEPGCAWGPMTAEDALRAVLRGDYGGIMINPEGRSFDLSREDVSDFFEVDVEASR